jgi:hypothetical protein
VFVEFDNARWYGSGSAIELEPVTAFKRIGEYHGFPVYARPGDDRTIYVPVTSGSRHLVTPHRDADPPSRACSPARPRCSVSLNRHDTPRKSSHGVRPSACRPQPLGPRSVGRLDPAASRYLGPSV